MAEFGVTSLGFVTKTQPEVLDDMEAQQRAIISPTWDPSPEQPTGQVNGVVSREIATVWELAEEVYLSMDRDSAEGQSLDNIGKLFGVPRSNASPSEVDLELSIESGTVLENGVHFAESETVEGQLWTPIEDYTAPSTGLHTVRFVHTVTGPVEAKAGSITIINTPVSGWLSVSQPSDADPGRNIETDEEYRVKQSNNLGVTGSSNIDAIAAKVVRVPGVTSVTVVENASPVESDGIPPHAFETVVSDGAPTVADNNAIAQAIWNNKPAGIQPYGSEMGVAVDVVGNSHDIGFSRVEKVPLYVDIHLQTDAAYPGDDAVIAAVIGTNPQVAEDISTSSLAGVIYALGGVRDIINTVSGNLGVKVGGHPVEAYVPRYEIGARQQGVYDSVRMAVTSTEWIDD